MPGRKVSENSFSTPTSEDAESRSLHNDSQKSGKLLEERFVAWQRRLLDRINRRGAGGLPPRKRRNAGGTIRTPRNQHYEGLLALGRKRVLVTKGKRSPASRGEDRLLCLIPAEIDGHSGYAEDLALENRKLEPRDTVRGERESNSAFGVRGVAALGDEGLEKARRRFMRGKSLRHGRREARIRTAREKKEGARVARPATALRGRRKCRRKRGGICV